MTVNVSPAVERDLVRRVAAADGVFCFLDYDGTLSPLAPTPTRRWRSRAHPPLCDNLQPPQACKWH